MPPIYSSLNRSYLFLVQRHSDGDDVLRGPSTMVMEGTQFLGAHSQTLVGGHRCVFLTVLVDLPCRSSSYVSWNDMHGAWPHAIVCTYMYVCTMCTEIYIYIVIC